MASDATRNGAGTGALRIAQKTFQLGAPVVVRLMAGSQRRYSQLLQTIQRWYKVDRTPEETMKLAVRPDTSATESDALFRTILRGDEAEGFLQLLERSKTHDPAKKAYLEEAVAFSEQMLQTGRLPD